MQGIFSLIVLKMCVYAHTGIIVHTQSHKKSEK